MTLAVGRSRSKVESDEMGRDSVKLHTFHLLLGLLLECFAVQTKSQSPEAAVITEHIQVTSSPFFAWSVILARYSMREEQKVTGTHVSAPLSAYTS